MGSNACLLRDRYLRVAVKDKANHPEARRDLFEVMCKSLAQSETIYQAAYKRQLTSLQTSSIQKPKAEGLFLTKGRMVIGLGGENVLETGITLHHTYGTPLIPGTALKGLASHYCDQVWGVGDQGQGFKRWKSGETGGDYHKAVFGTTEDSGHIIFHDAWIIPETLGESLQPDVMTPHHGDYYSDDSGNTPPTDFDDPNPVTFLSVVGTFHIAVLCDVPGEEGQKWAKLAFDLLTEALKEWGIGGKTNAGYGRMVLEGRDEGGVQPSVEAESRAATSPMGSGPQIPTKPIVLAAKKLKYKKGDIVEVTKVLDPKEKRGASYFMADDGIGGLVVLGTPPSIEIGQKTRLEINGVMEKEGLYNFAAVGAKREPSRQPRDRRGRR
ncbi:MAG: type III-B CRISPR module RAMP protein Cmr6 [Methanothrix sp.]|nr:type III-B CRISPR module RAMP protein Cmr6 [Methanothrix sp.]MDD4447319.1 type III-B CRISPR module RAMP protein Cmr6 [Methanothrix sp.]